MRNYFILSFSRILGAVTHEYNAVTTGTGRNLTYTGNYACTTLQGAEATKISTDFICMPNSAITGIKDNNRNLEWRVGETTTEGTIRAIRLNNRRAEVLLNAARTVYTDISTLHKVTVAPVVQPIRTAAAATPAASRSTLGVDSFTTLQDKIMNAPDIRLEKYLKKNLPVTLRDFMIEFFKMHNIERNTIFVADKTKIQTVANKRRSLGDIYKICKYYYPTCTLKEVLTLLYINLPTLITTGFRSSYCNTIKKRVWYYSARSPNGVYDRTHPDEYGYTIDWYTSKL